MSEHPDDFIIGPRQFADIESLLKRALSDPGLMSSDIVDVMEPPFPAVSTTDPVREAVELLAGEGQALTVTESGKPVGIVTRADLLESLVSS